MAAPLANPISPPSQPTQAAPQYSGFDNQPAAPSMQQMAAAQPEQMQPAQQMSVPLPPKQYVSA